MKNITVYIFINGKQEAIPLEKFQEMQQTNESYRKIHFVRVDNNLYQATDELYRRFCSEKNRRDYERKNAPKYSVILISSIGTKDYTGEELIADEYADTAETACNNCVCDQLKEIVGTLSKEEQALIKAIYEKGWSEREYARQSGVHWTTINHRHCVVLEKIKKLLF